MRAVLGWAIVLFSSFFVVAAVGDLVKGSGKTSADVLAGLLVFFAGTGYAGFRLARSGSKAAAEKAALRDAAEEQALLRAAAASDGSLTLGEAVARSGIPLARCKQLLERFTASGVAQLDFDPESNVIYTFPGLGRSTPPPVPTPDRPA